MEVSFVLHHCLVSCTICTSRVVDRFLSDEKGTFAWDLCSVCVCVRICTCVRTCGGSTILRGYTSMRQRVSSPEGSSAILCPAARLPGGPDLQAQPPHRGGSVGLPLRQIPEPGEGGYTASLLALPRPCKQSWERAAMPRLPLAAPVAKAPVGTEASGSLLLGGGVWGGGYL